MKASFTYKVITQESAKHGDVAERGWILPGHWEFPLRDDSGEYPATLNAAQAGEYNVTDLSTVVSFAQELGICPSEDADWISSVSSVDPDHGDYSTDEQRFYALHLEGVTESSKKRIYRLIAKY